ncbi:nuclease-related domain-containing protein [Ferrimonas senticii]|uniref:nuclease-related domain-containing protein n=1 Tax=Ferrimonas senticii TaxID=394566 RepID=UPI00041527A4|nr:nuclease-related domain-containing protein [Ferrimonas senticii]
MILKERDDRPTISRQQQAGAQQEHDVAFYLRREYADDPKVLVLHDLRFAHQGEISQIDHLIVYPRGFILIESKSINGQVRVNKQGEWARSYRGQWQGIASPIQQVKLQQQNLKKLLCDNAAKILPKFLFNMLQQGFGARRYDYFCAVSSNAMISRTGMPKEISERIVKTEFLVEQLRPLTKPLKLKTLINSDPLFNQDELTSIGDFLLAQHRPSAASKQLPAPLIEPINDSAASSQAAELACKRCNSTTTLSGCWGKYGYYVRCSACQSNTAMRGNCGNCASSNTTVQKQGASYFRQCNDCQSLTLVFIQPD